jgi:hypothetical protein
MEISPRIQLHNPLSWYLSKSNSRENNNQLNINSDKKNQPLLSSKDSSKTKADDKSFIHNGIDLSSNRLIAQRLQDIDAAVKAHEKTHLLILGGYAKGTIQYDYIILPNGEHYAVGGSIGVDLKPVPGDPEATIRKARIVRWAALGPNVPSVADKQIALEAYQMEMQAQRQLHKKELKEEINLESTEIPIESSSGQEKNIPDVTVVPGNPEATIQQARTVRRQVLMQGKISFRDERILIESYRIEKQAGKELEEQKQGVNRQIIDIYV